MKKWDIELVGIKEEYAKQVGTGIETMQSEFPVLNTISLKITVGDCDKENPAMTSKEKYGVKYRHVIYLSSYYFGYENHLCDLKGVDNDRFFDNYTDVIIHEFGHIMQDLYCCKKIFPYKYFNSMSLYIKFFRSSKDEVNFLKKLRKNIWVELGLNEEKCSYYLGKNSIKTDYEFFADCFNTYYYLKGDDTTTRENTREYKAFKISEYVVNMMKSIT